MKRRAVLAGLAATAFCGVATPTVAATPPAAADPAMDCIQQLRKLTPEQLRRLADMMRQAGDTDPLWLRLADAIEAMASQDPERPIPQRQG